MSKNIEEPEPTVTKPPRKSIPDRVRKIARLLRKPSYRRMLYFGLLGATGGIALYSLFGLLTGWESGLLGLPVGYLIGRAVQRGANGQGSKDAARLTVFLMILAFLLGDIPRALWQGVRDWDLLSTIGSRVALVFFSQKLNTIGQFFETIFALLSLVAGGNLARMINE